MFGGFHLVPAFDALARVRGFRPISISPLLRADSDGLIPIFCAAVLERIWYTPAHEILLTLTWFHVWHNLTSPQNAVQLP